VPRHSTPTFSTSVVKQSTQQTPKLPSNCKSNQLTKIKPEFAHPHHVLHNKVSLTIASPKGGEAPLDPSSVEMFKDEISVNFLNTQKALWANTEKLADMIPRVGEFDAIFYVGGHGRTSSLSEKNQGNKSTSLTITRSHVRPHRRP
jgi:hypothetical protein